MGQLIHLERYKGQKRKDYLKRYDTQIKKFVGNFLDSHLSVSYEDLSYHFIAQQQHAQAWDYVDFRDTLLDGIQVAFAKELLEACRAQYWFDERYLSEDELVEHCVSHLILGSNRAAR